MDEMLKNLDVARWPLGCQCKVTRAGRGANFQRGGMFASATEFEGLIEVVYEHAPHEITRERCSPSEAAQLIQLIFQRDGLRKIKRIRE
jgi:hypothetical protein